MLATLTPFVAQVNFVVHVPVGDVSMQGFGDADMVPIELAVTFCSDGLSLHPAAAKRTGTDNAEKKTTRNRFLICMLGHL